MKKLKISSQIVASLLALLAAVAIAPNIVMAGPKFDPHMAKGGLPECMKQLNTAVSVLEASQEDMFQMQTELATCEANAVVLSGDTAGVPQSGQIESYYPGDDGSLQMGIPLPVPRFTDNDDGTVTDNLTGLIWTQNANLSINKTTWYDALNLCYNLAADWRLPNIRELQSILDYGYLNPALADDYPFIDLQSVYNQYYWSSTTYAMPSSDAYPYAWGLSVINGSISPVNKGGNNGYVWCVRGEE